VRPTTRDPNSPSLRQMDRLRVIEMLYRHPASSRTDLAAAAPTAAAWRPSPVRVTAGTLGDRAEVLGAAALVLAQSPHALAARVGR